MAGELQHPNPPSGKRPYLPVPSRGPPPALEQQYPYSDQGPDVQTVLSFLRRRRGAIALGFVSVFAAVAALTCLWPKTYESSALMLVGASIVMAWQSTGRWRAAWQYAAIAAGLWYAFRSLEKKSQSGSLGPPPRASTPQRR